MTKTSQSRLEKTIEAMDAEIIQFAQRLISIPTVNPPGEKYACCSRFIAETLTKIGLEVKRVHTPKKKLREFDLESPRISVVGTWKGTMGKPTLHINGHYDVVPAGSGWSFDPFAAVIRDNKLFGRGATDMKGGIACVIMAVAALKRAGVRLKGNLSLSFVPDEEIGGQTGSGHLVENGFIDADMALLAEPGGIDTVTVGHRGDLWVEVTTLGKAAHGSRPHQGINAIEKMASIIMALQELKSGFDKITSKAPILPAECKHPTINIGTISGGIKTNVVPDRCVITIDRRIIPEETVQQALMEIEHVLKQADPDVRFRVKTMLTIDPAISPATSIISKAIVKYVRKIVGREATIRVSPAFLDFHYFANGMKIPVVSYGPGVLETSHSSDEYVPIQHLVLATKVYALAIRDVLGYE
jgi:succinyl-diaminopimelate desuccinylase